MKASKVIGLPIFMGALALLAGCNKQEAGTKTAQATSNAPKLGIRPSGDETVKIDMSKIKNADLPKIYDYIDKNIDSHVVNLQKWIQQPSISNTGEGIQESAEMVKGFFDQLGCQKTQVFDPGKNKWGSQSNPVVYAKCDEGAKKTLVVYWQGDTMPVTQPDLWKAPPFEGRLVEQAPYKKVLIGRGATNSKGPEMTFFNAIMSIKAVTGKLPVNLIFVVEHDEERMDVGLNKFMQDHADLLKGADAVWGGGGSEGCVFVELTTSGKSWGHGPVYSDIHGSNKRSVDSPAWRHITMLSKLVSPDGNKVLIPGFYDNIVPPTSKEEAMLRATAANYDLGRAAKNLGVARFISDDPYTQLKMARMGTSMNLDGIWGGNMFAGGSGAILPNKITSKHNFRYVPNMTGPDIMAKLRKYLDQLGYSDVEMHIVGDVPWAKKNTDNDLSRSNAYTSEIFGMNHPQTDADDSILLAGGGGGYWPAYLFSGTQSPINLPISAVRGGTGGNAHAANEWYVIEGAGKQLGMASAEKVVVTALYNFAGLNGPIQLKPTKVGGECGGHVIMRNSVQLVSATALALALAACGKGGDGKTTTAAAGTTGPKLGIRPYGDETVKPDMSKIKNADLPKIYDYIDKNIDSHVVNLQKWIQQPSISNTGEGIQESAEMVKGFFDQLGCQKTQVFDPGKTKWGSQANPVVYAKCDEGAKKTLVVYWQYDTMPVTQPDLWKAPPFEGRLVEQAPFKKVLIGRGATNSKGPEMTFFNAVMSIKAATGKLPVNLIFVAEGDEERMDVGLNAFMTKHMELFKGADGVWGPGGSEGCLFVELTTSGHSWGRGPDYSDIHGANKLSVDSPAWRHIKMLSKLVSDDGNTPLIPGFTENYLPMTPEEDAALRKRAANYDLKRAAKNLGVGRFESDDPYEVLKMRSHGLSMNLDGIWGGNMFAGGSGAILPNKITSKHNFRYRANMNGPDIAQKLRNYLDQLGYKDVEMHIVGDVPWAKRDQNNDLSRANMYASSIFKGGPGAAQTSGGGGGYWPAYLFSGKETNIDLPISSARGGTGGNAHAANEWYVIEGSGSQLGMASAEKIVATALYTFAGLNGPVPVKPAQGGDVGNN